MRIVMAVDLEGTTGVCSPEQVEVGGRLYAEACELAAGDINAAVEGLVEAGVDDIVVWDNHARSFNEKLAALHPAARVMRGGAANGLRWPTLDQDTDGLILLNYHAMAGTCHAVLEHTMSSRTWFSLKVNGRASGEIGYDAALAGAVGVPVIMVSGDDKTCAEARAFLGRGVTAVCLKQGLARHCAICLPPAKTAALLRTGAKRAVANIRGCKPFSFGRPAEVELVFKHTSDADGADLRACRGRRIDGYTVRWTARDFPAWHGFTTRHPPL